MSVRHELAIGDCEKCKKMNGKPQRQALACGYESPADSRVHLTVWQPPTTKAGYSGPELTVCAGYTAHLPEVIEASIARVHWLKGNLSAWDESKEDLLNAIVVLDGASNEVQRWSMTPAEEGGGRNG